MRLLIHATLAAACVAFVPAVALGQAPEELQKEFGQLAAEAVDELSEDELTEVIQWLKERRDEKEEKKVRERLATEIESRLVADFEFFQGLIEEYPRGSEVARVAEVMRTTLQDKIEFVRKWKAGKVTFPPPETTIHDQLLSKELPSQSP